MSDPGSDLALVAAISVVDRLCVDMDHPETGHFDALWQVPIEILVAVIRERTSVFVATKKPGSECNPACQFNATWSHTRTRKGSIRKMSGSSSTLS